MKIIREGNKIEAVLRGTCTKCGCVFEIEDDDRQNIVKTGPTLSHHCPNCGRVVRLVSTNLIEGGDSYEADT